MPHNEQRVYLCSSLYNYVAHLAYDETAWLILDSMRRIEGCNWLGATQHPNNILHGAHSNVPLNEAASLAQVWMTFLSVFSKLPCLQNARTILTRWSQWKRNNMSLHHHGKYAFSCLSTHCPKDGWDTSIKEAPFFTSTHLSGSGLHYFLHFFKLRIKIWISYKLLEMTCQSIGLLVACWRQFRPLTWYRTENVVLPSVSSQHWFMGSVLNEWPKQVIFFF